jgi:hypothetical protein
MKWKRTAVRAFALATSISFANGALAVEAQEMERSQDVLTKAHEPGRAITAANCFLITGGSPGLPPPREPVLHDGRRDHDAEADARPSNSIVGDGRSDGRFRVFADGSTREGDRNRRRSTAELQVPAGGQSHPCREAARPPLHPTVVMRRGVGSMHVGSGHPLRPHRRDGRQFLRSPQPSHTLAVTGPYAGVRHPQYVAFLSILFGFLLQWPTLLTLAMFPVLAVMYVRLARREEREVRSEFGEEYDAYVACTPAFLPRLRPAHEKATGGVQP